MQAVACLLTSTIYADDFYDLYVNTGKNVDDLELERLEETVDTEKLKQYYGVSLFKARVKLHQELKEYIEGNKAEEMEEIE